MKKLAFGLLALTISLGLLSTAASAQGFLLPIITVEPGSYDFGPVPIGAIASADLLVTNSGDLPLIVNAVKTRAPFNDNATSFTVPGHSSRRVSIAFIPTAVGTFSSVCTFQSNAANEPVLNVPITGTGIE